MRKPSIKQVTVTIECQNSLSGRTIDVTAHSEVPATSDSPEECCYFEPDRCEVCGEKFDAEEIFALARDKIEGQLSEYFEEEFDRRRDEA